MNNEEKNELRKLLGTLPESVKPISLELLDKTIKDPSVWEKTDYGYNILGIKFYEGVKEIEVEPIDVPNNPYRNIFEICVATWGSEEYPTMWPKTKPEHRFLVTKNAIWGKSLPLGLETVNFTFIVRKTSRASFDQHCRQRMATFASQGVRDNSRLLAGFRIPNELWVNEQKRTEIIKHVLESKKLYQRILTEGENSFQAARAIFPMNSTHNYKFSVDLLNMKSYMAQRLTASEQEDTVAVAMHVWNEINKRFPLLANAMRPKCDFAGKCLCHQSSGDELFGALFKGCGRFLETENNYATFNFACSDYEKLIEQTNVKLPYPDTPYWKERNKNVWKKYDKFEDLEESDKKLFSE